MRYLIDHIFFLVIRWLWIVPSQRHVDDAGLLRTELPSDWLTGSCAVRLFCVRTSVLLEIVIMGLHMFTVQIAVLAGANFRPQSYQHIPGNQSPLSSGGFQVHDLATDAPAQSLQIE